MYAARAFQILRNRLAQSRYAPRGAVAVAPCGYGIAQRIHDRRGGMKIRFAEFQVNDRAPLALEFFGAMAFLKENTVLEFFDLSLNDSARTTRLVLRQGSASFYVNPASGDYFSVTGGDFTVEAEHRSAFRLDNYDDGSTVETYQGRVSVLHNKNSTHRHKGLS